MFDRLDRLFLKDVAKGSVQVRVTTERDVERARHLVRYAGVVQRSLSVVVQFGRLGTLFQQRTHDVFLPALCREEQRRVSAAVFRVDVGFLRQQGFDEALK